MNTSPKIDPPQFHTEIAIEAPEGARNVSGPGEAHPSWLHVALALALLVWAVNWRRGKPGLLPAILRQLRR